MDNFAILDISIIPFVPGACVTITTDIPCHLTLYWTSVHPQKHPISRTIRGLAVPWYTKYCFVAYTAVEQIQAGDTLLHTFRLCNWPVNTQRWFTFAGTIAGNPSPSVGPLFTYTRPPIPSLATEEQTQYNALNFFLPSRLWLGQRLTISNRTVYSLAFVLSMAIPVVADIYFTIRRISDNALLASQFWGSTAAVPNVPTWLEATFDCPVFINEEVRILAENVGFAGVNRLRFHLQTSDVKAGEYYTHYQDAAWVDYPTWDAAYRYTHTPLI